MANSRHRVELSASSNCLLYKATSLRMFSHDDGLDEIKVVHFSGDRSLAEWCLGGYIDQISFEDFVSNTIIERMLILWRRDDVIGK